MTSFSRAAQIDRCVNSDLPAAIHISMQTLQSIYSKKVGSGIKRKTETPTWSC